MKLEYSYLFGLEINLEEYGLGRIKQPRLIDFINKDVDVQKFYLPFIVNDIVIGQSNSVEALTEVKKSLGGLTFFLTNCYQSQNMAMLELLKKSLGLLYDCEVVSGNKLDLIAGDVIIDNSNFDILSNVVLEMLKIDKSKMKFEKEEDPYKDIPKELLEAKKKYFERNKDKAKKEQGLTIIDIANIVIHSKTIDYDKVLNMTVYQIKNSYEIISSKESFDIGTLYRISPKFDTGKEKYEHWTEKIKLDKSSLSQ